MASVARPIRGDYLLLAIQENVKHRRVLPDCRAVQRQDQALCTSRAERPFFSSTKALDLLPSKTCLHDLCASVSQTGTGVPAHSLSDLLPTRATTLRIQEGSKREKMGMDGESATVPFLYS